jgi:hypothetical protein
VLCQDKELNEMWFFFHISALKSLAVATATPVFFALIYKKNNGHYNLTFYLDIAQASFGKKDVHAWQFYEINKT